MSPYLIATKVEAFKGRGNSDFRLSADVEDIVTLFDGVSDIVDQLVVAPKDVKTYLLKELSTWIVNDEFIEGIGSHISDRVNLEGRKNIILNRIKKLLEK